ncbi:MAG: aspartate carbamoyltransferase catalytic subunit [Nitrospirae bacterium]|nr:aspartate carbamoyltransferase catalytic subunit [Candidatus Troglogloeales bacterium]
MTFFKKDLLALSDLEKEEIELILATATSFKEVLSRDIKKVPTLRGKMVVNLFFEPSTRTRTSFELAAKRLSADLINISSVSSSLTKGESLLDTAKNIEAMQADIIILRHASSGAPALIARHLKSAIINAGDGTHEHPSQGLLDLFTIQEKKGAIAGLKVVIVGDILHSRVARSDIYGLKKMGAEVEIVGPPTMIPSCSDQWKVTTNYNLDKAVVGADVIILLRLQLERQGKGFFPTLREYARLYGLNPIRLAKADSEVLVMHPGPINRGVEITSDVADGLSSVILDQVTNGVAIRMAILYLLSGHINE